MASADPNAQLEQIELLLRQSREAGEHGGGVTAMRRVGEAQVRATILLAQQVASVRDALDRRLDAGAHV